MMRAIVLVLGGVVLAGSALAADPDGDPEAGRDLAGQCRTCHGLNGYAQIPVAPHIGGEPAEYLGQQLTAFREGRRQNEMMSVVASGLSDTDIDDLAAWYAAQDAAATLTADPEEAPQACTGCHGADGMAVVEDAPNLAGEANIYIDTQLKAFRSGERKDDVMSAITAEMTDAEIRAAADWYADVKLDIDAAE